MNLLRLKEHFANEFISNPITGEIGSIKLNLWMANLAGVPLIGLKKESYPLKALILLHGIGVASLITFIYTGFEFYDLFMNITDLDKATQNICLSFTHFSSAIKMMNLFYRYSDLKIVIRKLEYVTKTYITSDRQFETFKKGEEENKVAIGIYMGTVGFTACLGIFFLFIDPEHVAGQIFPYRVILPAWLPLVWQQLYMGLGVLVFGMQIVAVDFLNVTIINVIRFQLHVLNLSFKELIVDASVNTKNTKELMTFKLDPLKRLHAIIEHHCLLRDIRQETEDIFCRPLLWQFLTSLIIFAMTGFQATVRTGGTKGSLLIYLYIGCIFCQLFVYCWFGNEVSEQSKIISTSGFQSSWYLFGRRYGQSLLIFLANAQRPFIFTAGGFIALSLPTFAGILSRSYSYIALLRQLYGE